MTLSRFLVFPDSLTFDFVTTSDLLSTFLTLVFSSSKSFLVMVVCPPSKEAGGFAGTAKEESFFPGCWGLLFKLACFLDKLLTISYNFLFPSLDFAADPLVNFGLTTESC